MQENKNNHEQGWVEAVGKGELPDRNVNNKDKQEINNEVVVQNMEGPLKDIKDVILGVNEVPHFFSDLWQDVKNLPQDVKQSWEKHVTTAVASAKSNIAAGISHDKSVIDNGAVIIKSAGEVILGLGKFKDEVKEKQPRLANMVKYALLYLSWKVSIVNTVAKKLMDKQKELKQAVYDKIVGISNAARAVMNMLDHKVVQSCDAMQKLGLNEKAIPVLESMGEDNVQKLVDNGVNQAQAHVVLEGSGDIDNITPHSKEHAKEAISVVEAGLNGVKFESHQEHNNQLKDLYNQHVLSKMGGFKEHMEEAATQSTVMSKATSMANAVMPLVNGFSEFKDAASTLLPKEQIKEIEGKFSALINPYKDPIVTFEKACKNAGESLKNVVGYTRANAELLNKAVSAAKDASLNR